jgi:hypothetical protein
MAACNLRIRAATDTIVAIVRDDYVISGADCSKLSRLPVEERLRVEITCVMVVLYLQCSLWCNIISLAETDIAASGKARRPLHRGLQQPHSAAIGSHMNMSLSPLATAITC